MYNIGLNQYHSYKPIIHAERSNNVTKKHHTVKFSLYNDIFTLFPLVVPASRFCPIHIFREFYYPFSDMLYLAAAVCGYSTQEGWQWYICGVVRM